MMSSISVNLIARDNASGLTRDALMLMELLQGEGFNVSWCKACEGCSDADGTLAGGRI